MKLIHERHLASDYAIHAGALYLSYRLCHKEFNVINPCVGV